MYNHMNILCANRGPEQFMDCAAQRMDPHLICTLRGQSMDWTNLAQSTNRATILIVDGCGLH